MPKYHRWIESTAHYLHEVEADSIEQAKALFETNDSWCIDEQHTWNTTDIELVEE